jgi:hypothetical protein
MSGSNDVLGGQDLGRGGRLRVPGVVRFSIRVIFL